jgi:hypothetical protein
LKEYTRKYTRARKGLNYDRPEHLKNARNTLRNVGHFGGADEIRTHDLLGAIQALSQLSYGPTKRARILPIPPCAVHGVN